MWNIMKRVLVLLSPTLIGLVFLRILLVLPSPLENILYWLGPIAMTIYWLWIGACAATKGSMSFVPSLLYSHAGVLLCVVLFLLLPYMGYGFGASTYVKGDILIWAMAVGTLEGHSSHSAYVYGGLGGYGGILYSTGSFGKVLAEGRYTWYSDRATRRVPTTTPRWARRTVRRAV